MNSLQIKCFLTVARTLSFTEAANQMYLAQSTLSRNISGLEEELGLTLFVRTKKYVRLTPGGAVLYDEFSRIEKMKDLAIERAINAEKGETGSITIGILETQRTDTFLPAILQKVRSGHPNIQFDIISGTFRDLRENILNGSLDLALTLDFDLLDYPKEAVVSQVILHSKPKCVLAKSHPLAQNTMIHLDTLQGETMIAISPEVSKGAYESILLFCDRHDFTPANTVFVNSIQNALLKVEAGLGFSVLDENCISYNDDAVLSIPFYKSDPLNLVAVWRKDNLNPVVPLFTNYLIPE